MLGPFERELGQIDLAGKLPFSPRGGHERLNVLDHGFLTGDELGAQPDGKVALAIGQPIAILALAGKVDVGRILEFRVAAGKQP
ncbi:hypothetical protein [Mycobacterium attenuatum]|uniref:hypothetical protein n=1 Tax=Mycobacterium attenuatum TaxID=2341086 RepID=UPI000F2D256C|nr:hypothetical protein [Mycobacterium attenuatum]VBA46586.1 hypothetical protein LAUMK41_00387 [Mycobacterium attenuatum]